MLERQFSLNPKRCDQPWPPLHRAQSIARIRAELSEILDAKIANLVLLKVSPDVFGGVELRSVCGQELHFDVPVERFNELAHQTALVYTQPVPDDEQLAFDLSFKGL